ncbi:MAG: CRISPR-associated helicase Cas3' [Verrucomicrobia bacterium]|nr:CRISPR-associated helicase Cas3' [Verrucomicrobiota bacterium]
MDSGTIHFWAKTTADGQPGISVRDHCLNVGCVAEALCNVLPLRLRPLLPPGAPLLAAFHDVGKISPGFEQKCPVWMAQNNFPPQVGEPDHAKVSQWFLQQWLGADALNLKRWLMALGAHHGQSKGRWIKDARRGGISIGPTGGPEWQAARESLAANLAGFFGADAIRQALPETAPANDAALGFFAGLVAVSDWIGSDEHFFSPAVEDPPLNPEQRRARATSAVGAIGLNQLPAIRAATFADLFPPIQSPNELQQCAAEYCRQPGLWIIEAPMGCGKTEAALLAAGHAVAEGRARGIYFALPTQTTSNRIYERVEMWLVNLLQSSATLRLAHGASWLEDKQTIQVRPSAPGETTDEENRENPWAAQYWFSSARRALLASFGVGTVDQALLGVVAARHFFVRLFGLAGKVVVLDEVHGYDLYTGTLLDLLVEQLLQLRCTVIVLSATLTRQRREQLLSAARRVLAGAGGLDATATNVNSHPSDAYPLLTGVTAAGVSVEVPIPQADGSHRKVRLCCHELPIEEAAAECARRAEAGQVVLWVRNTVDSAQRSLGAVCNALRQGGAETALLHSRFPWFCRDELEALWLTRLGKDAANRPKGAVIVATQVVEQSVDIDADFLLTDLAPTDMLLQRLGRLWRHARADRPNQAGGPEAWIHTPDFEGRATVAEIKAHLKGLAPPYAAYVLLRSAREWRRFTANGGIALPADIRAILEATYASWPDEPESWRTLRQEMERRAEKLRSKAVSAANAWVLPTLPDDEGVQTRYIDYPTATLVLLQSLESRRGEVRLATLEGTSVAARERDWSREVAVALHRNHLKIPAWWLRGRDSDNPPPLKPYFVGRWALATVDGENIWLNGREGENAGLKYVADHGVWREPAPGQLPSPDYEDDYESDDC